MNEYIVFNQILDAIDHVLILIMRKKGLAHATIERWRWDHPEITLTWLGADVVWRNITTLIKQPPPSDAVTKGHIEVNAWYDQREEEKWVRHWKHAVIERGKIVPERWCHNAYETILSWDKGMLVNRHPLSESTAAVLEANMPQHRT